MSLFSAKATSSTKSMQGSLKAAVGIAAGGMPFSNPNSPAQAASAGSSPDKGNEKGRYWGRRESVGSFVKMSLESVERRIGSTESIAKMPSTESREGRSKDSGDESAPEEEEAQAGRAHLAALRSGTLDTSQQGGLLFTLQNHQSSGEWSWAAEIAPQLLLQGTQEEEQEAAIQRRKERLGRRGAWQKHIPLQLGKRLMAALRGWERRVHSTLRRDLLSFLVLAQGVVEEEACATAGLCPLFEDHPAARALWDHYDGDRWLRLVVDDALGHRDHKGELRAPPPRECTLSEAVEDYRRRNAVLEAMRYNKRLVGRLEVTILSAKDLRPKESLFQALSKPSSWVCVRLDGTTSLPLATPVVKREAHPRYGTTFSIDLEDAGSAGDANLHLSVEEKKTLGDDERIGDAHLNLAHLAEGEVWDRELSLHREGEALPVGTLSVSLRFEYVPHTIRRSVRVPAVFKTSKSL